MQIVCFQKQCFVLEIIQNQFETQVCQLLDTQVSICPPADLSCIWITKEDLGCTAYNGQNLSFTVFKEHQFQSILWNLQANVNLERPSLSHLYIKIMSDLCFKVTCNSVVNLTCLITFIRNTTFDGKTNSNSDHYCKDLAVNN